MINRSLINFLLDLEIKNLKRYKNMVIFPIIASTDYDLTYITLSEAIESKNIEITEISSRGSVPDLKVINKGEIPILLVDGEELKGAKQNRVMNASILIREKSETIIPVSCTEQGRWSYKSKTFTESGDILFARMRSVKSKDVGSSLKNSKEYHSDQGKIWNLIDDILVNMKVHSSTRAMNDIYKAKNGDLYGYLNELEALSGQTGLVVFINGKIVGMDVFSNPLIYYRLHRKMIRSYAMDAISCINNDFRQPERNDVLNFFENIREAEYEKFKSPGYGWDYRFRGKMVVGSALIHQDTIIHLTCFATRKCDDDDRMVNMRTRRNYYR